MTFYSEGAFMHGFLIEQNQIFVQSRGGELWEFSSILS